MISCQFPELAEILLERGYEEYYFQPEYLAFKLIAYLYEGNVSDLRRDRARARKVRMAFAEIGICFAPRKDFAEAERRRQFVNLILPDARSGWR